MNAGFGVQGLHGERFRIYLWRLQGTLDKEVQSVKLQVPLGAVEKIGP